MVKEKHSIDISDMPEALRLAEEVRDTQEPRVLRRDGEDIAVIMPIRRRRTRGKPFTKDDPLAAIVGLFNSGQSDVSERKHEYLAEAYEKHISR